MRFCTHCGAATEPETRSCSRCGTLHALSPPAGGELHCESCGEAIESAWRHCAECGMAPVQATTARMTRTSIAAEASAFTPDAELIEADEPAPPPAEDRWPAKLHP
jgi:predicted nucleic acid-binding Zn ribbon protein